jgi:hypothetical protein
MMWSILRCWGLKEIIGELFDISLGAVVCPNAGTYSVVKAITAITSFSFVIIPPSLQYDLSGLTIKVCELRQVLSLVTIMPALFNQSKIELISLSFYQNATHADALTPKEHFFHV